MTLADNIKPLILGFLIGIAILARCGSAVAGGGAGHFGADRTTFEPAIVNLEPLLDMFLRSIGPTDAGGRPCDRAESYRTAIFVSDRAEMAVVRKPLAAAQAALGQEIVTPVLSASRPYPAEEFHQDYYKGRKLVLTRFGPMTQARAYKRYPVPQGLRADRAVMGRYGSLCRQLIPPPQPILQEARTAMFRISLAVETEEHI